MLKHSTISGRPSKSSLRGLRRFRGPHAAIAPLVDAIRSIQSDLKDVPESQLAAMCIDLRTRIATGTAEEHLEITAGSLALIGESIRRSAGVDLYDVQFLAALGLCHGHIVQMQTGEGKSYAALAAAAFLGLTGRGVHVATPNLYLATRDCEQAAACLAPIGISVGLLGERVPAEAKRRAYDCDITYGTGHEFGFDYLRDQLTLRPSADEKPGVRLLRELSSGISPGRRTMQRGLNHMIVDEADSVMLDDAGSPLVLSLAPPSEAEDAAAHMAARDLAELLTPEDHFEVDATTGSVTLTEEGVQRCHDDEVNIPISVLVRPWSDYVRQALRAQLLFRRDVHYVIHEGEVRIVDESTGRIYEDRSWQEGLHQAIEAREGLTITAETVAAARITRQRFFRLYTHVCGLTGTAVGCERELQQVYNLGVMEVPLRLPSAAMMLPTRFFASADAKWTAITHSIRLRFESEQPVLVGTQSILDSEELSRRLQAIDLPHNVLNGRQDASEADLIAQAGRRRAVTIATNLAGRGTDIKIDEDVRALGGLHVIVAECQTCRRMDRQLTGRAARQGDPGSSQMFVSADDSLLRVFGGWLAQVMRRQADAEGECHTDFSSQLRRIQAAAERRQVLGRLALLEQDRHRESLLAGPGDRLP